MHELVTHPALGASLAVLRDATTGPALFRTAGRAAGLHLVSAATAALATAPGTVSGPLGAAPVRRLAHRPLVVPILRAGLLFLDAAFEVIPDAELGLIGLSRDEQTLDASVYVSRLPSTLADRPVVVCEPMVATGGSLVTVLDLLTAKGATDVSVASLLASPEGLAVVAAAHPDARVFVAAIDSGLNDRGFILPGLGDAGDRAFGAVF